MGRKRAACQGQANDAGGVRKIGVTRRKGTAERKAPQSLPNECPAACQPVDRRGAALEARNEDGELLSWEE